MSPEEEAALTQPAGRSCCSASCASTPLAASVAPGLDETGVMLPYSPLHHLLLEPVVGTDTPSILVMTSGNLADEPLCYRNDGRPHPAGAASPTRS